SLIDWVAVNTFLVKSRSKEVISLKQIVAALPMDEKRATAFGLMKIDEEGRIIEFAEKPKGEQLKAMKFRVESYAYLLLCVSNEAYIVCTVFEKNPTKIKNYGIWLHYQSRTGYHNMYKEYRDTTLNGSVEQIYTELASRHRVRFPCIQIIKTTTIPAKLCKRESTKQFHKKDIKFPQVFQKVRPPTRKLKTTYKATKPNQISIH
ncbi:hypothetical protein GIB67_007699, partial [Kingdonia uniflora]